MNRAASEFFESKDANKYCDRMYGILHRYHGDDDKILKVLQDKVTKACQELDFYMNDNPLQKVQLQNLFSDMNKDLLNLPYLM